VLEEELDGAQGDGCSRARPLFDIDDVKEVVSEFLLRDEVRGLVEVISELTDGADIALLGADRVSSELKRLDHSLAKFGHGNTSCLRLVIQEV
jgi:hypothetical protein